MKKKCIIGIAIIIVWSIGVIKINNTYSEVQEEKCGILQEMEYNGLTISIEKEEFMDKESINKIFEKSFGRNLEQQCMLLYMNITNKTDEKKTMELNSLVLQSGAYKNMVIMEVYEEVNDGYIIDDKITLHPEIQPGDTYRCILAYTIPRVQYTKKQWEKVKENKYYLVVSLYPVKKVIEL